ncbi:MAG: alpha/beta fold hydrolase [Acidobacteria bacterium]|nr:alpha/beta fold hydrolase [Acidobacteriota bacterium]
MQPDRRATAADGATLHYRLAGSGPVVVLTHGLGGHLDSWEPTVDALQDRYTVLTWDVRGFGGSERRPDTMAPEVWASDLAAVLDEVGADDAVIGGISMGGVVSQRFALDFPDRTRALILISTSSEVNERATAGWNARADLIARDGLAKALTPTGPALSYGKEYRERHADDIAEAARLTIERNDAACYAAACRAVSDIDYTADLATISCPTLILQGLEDALTPPGGSVIMSRRIPDARLVMLEHCGHGIPTERPDEFHAEVGAFLANVA